jgi:hypothetical protein
MIPVLSLLLLSFSYLISYCVREFMINRISGNSELYRNPPQITSTTNPTLADVFTVTQLDIYCGIALHTREQGVHLAGQGCCDVGAGLGYCLA